MWFLMLISLISSVAGATSPHKFYVSYGRMAIEDNVAVCRIRFFQDDLEDVLRWSSGDETFRLAATARADATFLDYISSRFRLEQDGKSLPAEVVASGEEQDMWWYTVQFTSETTIKKLQITNRSLFDLLPDQRNILKVSHFPSEKERTLYFVVGTDTYDLEFE